MESKEEAKAVLFCRLTVGLILLSLCYRWLIHVMPYDFLNPPMFSLALELSFRAFMFLHLNEILVSSPAGSVIFPVLLLCSALSCLIFPRRNLLVIIFSLLYFLYYLSYNTFTIIHSHHLTIMVWMTIPFWVRKPGSRLLLWEGLRYYVCFIYVASFIYKISGGAIFDWNNGVNSVKWNLAKYLYYFPDTATSGLIRSTLSYPGLINSGSLLIFILEGLMVVGFFTRKYDLWLLWIPIITHLTTYIFTDVFFIEMFVLIPLFLNDENNRLPDRRFFSFLAR